MNVTQLLAWVIALALAFFAGLMGAHNAAKTAMLEKQFTAVRATANDQTAALREINMTLRQIEGDLKSGAALPAADKVTDKVQVQPLLPEAASQPAPQPAAVPQPGASAGAK